MEYAVRRKRLIDIKTKGSKGTYNDVRASIKTLTKRGMVEITRDEHESREQLQWRVQSIMRGHFTRADVRRYTAKDGNTVYIVKR